MIRFEQNDRVFIYDFNKLCVEQIIIAEQAFNIQGERFNLGAKNSLELEQLTTDTSLFKAYGILLLEMQNNIVISFNLETHEGEQFFRKMNAENMLKVYNGTTKNVNKKDEKGKTIKKNGKFVIEKIKDCEGIQQDFFLKLKRPSHESQRQLRNMRQLLNQQQSGLGLNISETMKNVGSLLNIIEKKEDSLIKMKAK